MASLKENTNASIILSEGERSILENWCEAEPEIARRCRIVLKTTEGSSTQQVASELCIAIETVGKWRKRFVKQRLAFLGFPRQALDPEWFRPGSTNGDIVGVFVGHGVEAVLFFIERHTRPQTNVQAHGDVLDQQTHDALKLIELLNGNSINRIKKPAVRERFQELRAFWKRIDQVTGMMDADSRVHMLCPHPTPSLVPFLKEWCHEGSRYVLHLAPNRSHWNRTAAKIIGAGIWRESQRGYEGSALAVRRKLAAHLARPMNDDEPFQWTIETRMKPLEKYLAPTLTLRGQVELLCTAAEDFIKCLKLAEHDGELRNTSKVERLFEIMIKTTISIVINQLKSGRTDRRYVEDIRHVATPVGGPGYSLDLHEHIQDLGRCWPSPHTECVPPHVVPTCEFHLHRIRTILATRRLNADERQWYTSTQAAERLRTRISKMSLGYARKMVSQSARTDAFQTNNLKGRALRIEPVSLDAWVLEQSAKALDREENGPTSKRRPKSRTVHS